MAKRLSDAELAQRTRAGNRRRSEHHRQRLESAGRVQLVVWTPVEIKTALESLATNRNQTLSATATALLSAALSVAAEIPQLIKSISSTDTPDTLDMFGIPDSEYRVRPDDECPVCGISTEFPHAPDCEYRGAQRPLCVASQPNEVTTSRVIQSDKEALMTEVGAMLELKLSGGEIARRLNSAGRRTASGAEFTGANLLRDYRKWTEKKETTTAV